MDLDTATRGGISIGNRQHQLRRSRSWPPVLTIPDADIPLLSELHADETDWTSKLTGKLSLEQNSLSASESKSSSHSSSKALSHFSSVSEISVEQRKDGFRASVFRRWLLTKQALSDKARLYREHYRAYHQQHRLKSDDALGADKQDSDNHLAPDSKFDSHLSKKDHAKKYASKHKEFCSAVNPNAGSPQDSRHMRPERLPSIAQIINSPHELSLAYSLVGREDRNNNDDEEEEQEEERGRRGRDGHVFSGQAIYPRVFSSRGDLLVDSKPLATRKSRTASGRRRSWREPSPAIVPVHEESQGSSTREPSPSLALGPSSKPTP